MDIKDLLAAAIKDAAQKAIDNGTLKPGTLPEVMLEVPPQKDSAILQPTLLCSLPAACIVHRVRLHRLLLIILDCASVDKMEIAGPGFINFYLKQNWTADLLAGILLPVKTTAICLLTAWAAFRLNM